MYKYFLVVTFVNGALKSNFPSAFPGWRLTFDSEVHGAIHGAISIVSNAGVDSILKGAHLLQLKGDVRGRIPEQLLIAKHPGDAGRRVAVHLTVK